MEGKKHRNGEQSILCEFKRISGVGDKVAQELQTSYFSSLGPKNLSVPSMGEFHDGVMKSLVSGL
jgi:hypothetical protein